MTEDEKIVAQRVKLHYDKLHRIFITSAYLYTILALITKNKETFMIKKIILGIAVSVLLSGCMVVGAFQKVTPPTAIPTLTPAAASTPNAKPTLVNQPALGGKQSGELLVWIYGNPSPPIRGANTLEVFVADTTGKPVTDAKVSFDIDMTNMSHGKNVVAATALSDGRYSGSVHFLMPGPWRVIVGVDRNGQTEKVRFEFNVNWQ
jgi:hypothetical protein